MFGIESCDAKRIVGEISDYMKNQGLVFESIKLNGASSYAILLGKSSVGYRTRSKWNKSGIVFFCSEVDASNLSRSLGLTLDDNSGDPVRPYAVFVKDNQVSDVIQVLKKNQLNTGEISSDSSYLQRSVPAKRGDSYQAKFWTEYFPHVKQCLARDGYSSSDSNTETTVRDTFYLERKDSRDFLSWFESKETVEEAKKRIIELLTVAARRSSNLKNDIKYYSRDIDYFAEFYWKTKGKTYEGSTTREDSRYAFVKTLKGKENVSLVRSRGNGDLFVRKEYNVYNADVFNRIREAGIDGLPELIEINEVGNRLYTIEQYIDGDTLLEIFERTGPLDEDMIRTIVMQLCRILKSLHAMNPQVLHRDIKPSNIMMDKQGKIYLIDFNASKQVHGNTSEDTVLYGTQYFAAPEQLIGYMASSPATDIFSLGATLSYLMTGMYHSQMIAPGKYKKVLMKCVEMSPKDRYQSVEEFEQAFLNA